MEKKLNRQIGFKVAPKKKTVPQSKKAESAYKPVVKKIEVVRLPKPEPAQDALLWIKSHPLFKWGGMCTAIGANRSNFYTDHIKGQKPIPEVLLKKIEAVLKEYGF